MYFDELADIVNKYNNTYHRTINPIQDGVGHKGLPASFSCVAYTNVGVIYKDFLTFSFNPFFRLALSRANPKLLNLNQEHPSKNWFFKSS